MFLFPFEFLRPEAIFSRRLAARPLRHVFRLGLRVRPHELRDVRRASGHSVHPGLGGVFPAAQKFGPCVIFAHGQIFAILSKCADVEFFVPNLPEVDEKLGVHERCAGRLAGCAASRGGAVWHAGVADGALRDDPELHRLRV